MKLPPFHPGEILREDFMRPFAIGPDQLAQALNLPPSEIHGILNGVTPITPDTARRLGTHFRVAPETWLTLQADYDRRIASPQ